MFLLLSCSFFRAVYGQTALNGAWKMVEENNKPVTDREVVAIYGDSYFMFGEYKPDGSFINAGGGTYNLKKKDFEQTFGFNTADSTMVGLPETFDAQLKGNQFTITNKQEGTSTTWQKMEEKESPLDGVWRFATRIDETGQPGERRKPGPRQTIKLLSEAHFQWAAFNSETKEFFGTGGGTYTAENGTYTEHIEFFSRDNNRVGQSLSFEFNRKGNDWYHKGESSTGKPLHEIWTIVK